MAESLEAALAGLNDEQKAAATEFGHCQVTACPGSGKTKMLSVKAALLLRSWPTERVGILTFTKDGALELKKRTIDLLGDDTAAAKRLLAGTFHSLCYRMLSKVRDVNLKNIISESEQLHYAQRAVDLVGIEDVDAMTALGMIEHARALPEVVDREKKALAAAYIDILKRNGKIDFSDLVIDTVTGLESGLIAPLPVASMLIDEFQDTDALQYRFAKCHSAAGTKITIVGDDDQAIFGWRFALGYEGMMKFAVDHDAHRIVLGKNYRCHAEILDAAGRLIVFNVDRVPKTLVAAKGPGGVVTCHGYPGVGAEADAVMEAHSGFTSGTYSAAVISRTNRSLRAIEAVLKAAEIPCTITKSASLFSAIETHIYLDLVDVVATGNTKGVDNALAWSGMQPQDLKSIHAKFANQLIVGNKSDFETMELDSDSEKRWKTFVYTMLGLQKNNEHGEKRINLLLEGVRSWMEDHNASGFLSASSENLGLIHKVFSGLKGDLKTRLEAVRRMAKSDSKDDGQRKVVLTTMHKSKGLEWDRVTIIRAEDGVCPGKDSNCDEERRLFYVAMTRARQQLHIGFSNASSKRSQFIGEAKLPVQTFLADGSFESDGGH